MLVQCGGGGRKKSPNEYPRHDYAQKPLQVSITSSSAIWLAPDKPDYFKDTTDRNIWQP